MKQKHIQKMSTIETHERVNLDRQIKLYQSMFQTNMGNSSDDFENSSSEAVTQ